MIFFFLFKQLFSVLIKEKCHKMSSSGTHVNLYPSCPASAKTASSAPKEPKLEMKCNIHTQPYKASQQSEDKSCVCVFVCVSIACFCSLFIFISLWVVCGAVNLCDGCLLWGCNKRPLPPQQHTLGPINAITNNKTEKKNVRNVRGRIS